MTTCASDGTRESPPFDLLLPGHRGSEAANGVVGAGAHGPDRHLEPLGDLVCAAVVDVDLVDDLPMQRGEIVQPVPQGVGGDDRPGGLVIGDGEALIELEGHASTASFATPYVVDD